jgi:hypothetical protein
VESAPLNLSAKRPIAVEDALGAKDVLESC